MPGLTLGIMQPYFFPYIGYFALIANTDRWVTLDVVQYRRRSWMNRNRILHPTHGWQYICAPVRHAPQGSRLTEIRLLSLEEAHRRILGQLHHYRRHAPYYQDVVSIVEKTFTDASNDDSLCALNMASLSAVCRYLGVRFDCLRCSELAVRADDIEHPGQWALKICGELGATAYLNPVGGRGLFMPYEWREAGICLRFAETAYFTYGCAPYEFQPHLSILDVMMWCSPNLVRSFLEEPRFAENATPNS